MNQPRTDREMQALAYHEAGHAAVTVALGGRVERVALTPGNADHEGYSKPEMSGTELESLRNAFECGDGDDELVHQSIVIALAGRVAQQKAGLDLNDDCDGQDIRSAFDQACALSGDMDGAQELVDRSAVRARALLDDPRIWAGVERLAAELLRVESIDCAEVARILSG